MSDQQFWHGGQRGLRVGSYLEPPTVTGAACSADYAHGLKGGHVVRRDVVYVTTDPVAAVMFGAMHPSGGAVYRVEPDGELRHDPDCDMTGLSYECARARIVSARNVSGYERRKVMRAMFSDVAAGRAREARP